MLKQSVSLLGGKHSAKALESYTQADSYTKNPELPDQVRAYLDALSTCYRCFSRSTLMGTLWSQVLT
jgi:hypothetical protein